MAPGQEEPWSLQGWADVCCSPRLHHCFCTGRGTRGLPLASIRAGADPQSIAVDVQVEGTDNNLCSQLSPIGPSPPLPTEVHHLRSITSSARTSLGGTERGHGLTVPPARLSPLSWAAPGQCFRHCRSHWPLPKPPPFPPCAGAERPQGWHCVPVDTSIPTILGTGRGRRGGCSGGFLEMVSSIVSAWCSGEGVGKATQGTPVPPPGLGQSPSAAVWGWLRMDAGMCGVGCAATALPGKCTSGDQRWYPRSGHHQSPRHLTAAALPPWAGGRPGPWGSHSPITPFRGPPFPWPASVWLKSHYLMGFPRH